MRSLGGRKLLFSEANQAIFELDDGAGRIWDQLELDLSPEEIVRELPDETTLSWLLSMREADALAVPAPEQRRHPVSSHGMVLELAQVAVELDVPANLRASVEGGLGYLKSTAREAQASIVIRESGDRIELQSNGRQWSCSPDEFIPFLKGELLDEVLRSATYEVALHAAALVRDDRLLLLCGSPGAGKTTLAIALTRSGFAMAADDVLLLDGDGLGTGLPFPFAAKSPSWPLIEQFYPGASQRQHLRPDGKVVRYILPEDRPAPAARAVGFVLFLDRQTGVQAKIEPVDPTDALAALIAEGSARQERLSRAGFEALVQMLTHARCCALAYSDLADAVEAVQGLYA